MSFQFTDYCLLFTGRLRRAFGNTEKSSHRTTPYTHHPITPHPTPPKFPNFLDFWTIYSLR
ncbi:MAG: hypothetical protein DWQ58_08530 [Microcystis aeruginosa TA09]|nr:MAG: hypothetical protein DWQ58_08530 [Microcystis aeruginosa TA09]